MAKRDKTLDLQEKIYHTDARVTAMEGKLSSLEQTVERGLGDICAQLRSVSKQIHTPNNINWAAWAGVGLSVLVMVAGGLYGVAQYVSLVNEPINRRIDENRDTLTAYRDFQAQTHYEFGGLHSAIKMGQSDITTLQSDSHNRQQQIAEIRKELGGLTSKISAQDALLSIVMEKQ